MHCFPYFAFVAFPLYYCTAAGVGVGVCVGLGVGAMLVHILVTGNEWQVSMPLLSLGMCSCI